MSKFVLSIGDVVSRTGVAEPTLRMWERRYGFPQPERTESGHRRYSENQVELVQQVVSARAAGASLRVAIDRAQARSGGHALSLFSSLRRWRPELEPRIVARPAMIAFSHAVEDEVLARADAHLLFGAFQRADFYRSAEHRWRQLAESAAAVGVFADFERGVEPEGAPAEIPIERRQPLSREWGIVAHGQRSAIALVARESASSSIESPSATRRFELIWTVEPAAVGMLAGACVEVAAPLLPAFAARAAEALMVSPLTVPAEQERLTMAILSRTLSALA